MAWQPTPKEIAAVLSQDGRRRYEYFLHRVCETGKVWSLHDDADGWAAFGDEGGERLLPFWPHPHYASLLATGAWDGYEPRAIELAEFIETWLPGLKTNGLQPSIFPTPAGAAVTVAIDDLLAHLVHELGEDSAEP